MQKNSRNIISQLNIYSIIKKKFLNCLTMAEYQTLLGDQVLKGKVEGQNAKPRPFSNQMQCIVCVIALDDFSIII